MAFANKTSANVKENATDCSPQRVAGREARLFALWERIPFERSARDSALTPSERLRNLIIRLSENWSCYRVFDWQPEVPWINNTTEQVIGRMKVRSRTVQGDKTPNGLLNDLMLAGSGLC